MENEYGARIERGKIVKKSGSKYKVESYDRKGITSPFIEAIDGKPTVSVHATHDKGGESVSETLNGNVKVPEYNTGDIVFFFLFADGTGAILGKIS